MRTSSQPQPTSRSVGPAAAWCWPPRSTPTPSTRAARWCSVARCRTSWPPRPWLFAEARQPSFQAYAQQVADNAQAFAEGLMRRGANLVTGGTDNHLVLLDVQSFGLTGRQAESALLDSGIVTNRNSIPADPNGAWYTSGIRFGTPALTTRGFGPSEFDRVAELVVEVLSNTKPEGTSKAKYTLVDSTSDWAAPRQPNSSTPTRCIRVSRSEPRARARNAGRETPGAAILDNR